MNGFRTNIIVDVHDVDFNGVARTSALMRYIQTAAQNQLTENGMSYDHLKERKRAFLLSRIKMEFFETIRAYQPLTAISFPCHSRGFSFLRCYELRRDDIIVGQAISMWALIDTDTHSLVKVNDFDLGLDLYDPLEIPMPRILIPHNIEFAGNYTVNYDDVDQNNHMNNTRYPDMYSNFLNLENKRIQSITINYMNEAPAKDTLKVEKAKLNGLYYFRTTRSDGKVNTEAEIKLCDI